MKRKIVAISLIILFFLLGLTDAHFLWVFFQANKGTDVVAIPILTLVGFAPLWFGVKMLRSSSGNGCESL